MVAGLKTFSVMDHYLVMDSHRKNFWVFKLKCMLEGGSTQKKLYQALHIPIRTIQNWWRQNKKVESMESKSGGDRQSILSRTAKIVIAKYSGEKSLNQKAHLKIACSWPSCIPNYHTQVHEEEFECFKQKIVAKHVRANFSAGQSSGSHSKKDPRIVRLQLGLFFGTKVHSQGTVWTRSKTYEPLFRKKSISCQKPPQKSLSLKMLRLPGRI